MICKVKYGFVLSAEEKLDSNTHKHNDNPATVPLYKQVLIITHNL